MKRIVTSAIAAAVSLTVLAACSSGEAEPAPEPEVTIGNGPGTFTSEEQQVVDAVEGYYDALTNRGDADVEAAMDGRLTDALAAQLIPDEKKLVDDADLEYIGEAVLAPEAVTIDGDTATFTGCRDSSELFLVPAGETTAGVGSRAFGIKDVTVELVRDGGRWLVDQPSSEEAQSC